MTRSATHWMTADDWTTLVTPGADVGTGLEGRSLGRTSSGLPFVADPAALYRGGLVTNPNVVVAGAMGSGKSTVVKMLAARSLDSGSRVVILDPKGEYGELARACSLPVVDPGRSGWLRPYDGDPSRATRALLAAALGRPLGAELSHEVTVVLAGLGPPWPPRVWPTLLNSLNKSSGLLRAACSRLVDGDLAGVFDGPGDPVDVTGPGLVIDLSRRWNDASLPVVALGAVLASQEISRQRGATMIIADEAWAMFDDPATVAWLRGSWKLARATATSHVLVVHQWRDVEAATRTTSVHRAALASLLRECETWWLFRHGIDDAGHLARTVGLSSRERATIESLSRGRALVRFGPWRSIVDIEPDELDRHVIDTDGAWRESR